MSAGTAAPSGQVDAVTLGVIKGAIQSARREMETLIERTAMSPFLREKKDYFASIFDTSGRLVTATGLPAGANMMECVLEEFPLETMQPGDLYWYNDCFRSVGGVSHFPDMVFTAPVFVDGQVLALSATYGHFTDIGGMVAGSMTPLATEAYQEGIIVPPIKIYEAGRLNEAVMKIFLRNSRFPEIMEGDIRAVQAGCKLGVTRLMELANRFGAERLQQSFTQIRAQTAAGARRGYMSLPDGRYTFSEHVDADPLTGDSPKVQATLEKTGERIVVDLTGSDDQTKSSINFITHECVPQLIYGMYFNAGDPSLLVNEGLFQVVSEVRVREGSILRPRFPAAIALRSITLHRLQEALFGTLAQASSGNSMAASPVYVIIFIRTTDPANGKPKLVADGIAVGYGARPDGDGLDAIYFIAQKNYPAEFSEHEYPLEILRYGLREDSGGPGGWRGGCGVIKEMRLLAPRGTLMARMDNVRFPPWGVAGGMGGRSGRFTLNPGTDRERVLASMSDGIEMQAGDVLRIETCGGGGWGHPFDRPAADVRHDVACGFVTVAGARRDYGVVLSPDGERIDADATRDLRTHHRPPAKLFHRTEYFDG